MHSLQKSLKTLGGEEDGVGVVLGLGGEALRE